MTKAMTNNCTTSVSGAMHSTMQPLRKVWSELWHLEEIENMDTFINKKKLVFISLVCRSGDIQAQTLRGIYKMFYRMQLMKGFKLLTCAHNKENNLVIYALAVIQQMQS